MPTTTTELVARLALICAALAWSAPALADDYPVAGTFTLSGSADAALPDDPARCALTFFTEDKAGAWLNYHLDLAGFRATGKVRYLIYSQGICTYTPQYRLESCNVTADADPTQVGATYVDVIDQLSDNFIKVSNFDTAGAAKGYVVSGAGKGRDPTAFFRCPFDPAAETAALSQDWSKLDNDARMAVIAPDDSLLHGADVAAVMKLLGLSAH